MRLIDRFNFCMSGEDGASNLEIIVWMAVVLVIAGFLFAFRAQVSDFISSATGQVKTMDTNMGSYIDKGAAEMSKVSDPTIG